MALKLAGVGSEPRPTLVDVAFPPPGCQGHHSGSLVFLASSYRPYREQVKKLR